MEIDVEGGAAPDVAPTGGDGLRTAAFLGAQEGG